MSRQQPVLDFVVEWSPDAVSVFDPRLRSKNSFRNLIDASGSLGAGKSVRVAISRRSSFIRAVRVPDAPKAEVVQMLGLAAGTHLPLPPHETSFDVRLTGDLNSEGRLGIIGAVRSDDLRDLHAQLQAAHWQAVDILPAALGSILVAEQASHPSCAVVQKNDEGWAIDLIVDGELRYSRTLPASLPTTSIDEEVSRTYAAAQLSCSALVTAGGLALSGASRRIEQSSLELLASPQADNLGLHVELREILQARQASARASRLRWAGLLLTAAVLLAGYAINDRTSAQAAVSRQKALWAVADRKANALKTDQDGKLAALQAMQGGLDRGFHPAQRMSDVLTVVSNLAPNGLWLTGVGIERGKPLLIRGTATTSEAVSAYVKALSAEKRLRDVRLVFANNGTIEQRPVVQFSISAFAVGNLPLNDNPVVGKSK